MSKENKLILILQLLISVISILFLINQPERFEFVNGNTGESLNAMESFLVFNFFLLAFGALWGAGLFVLIVEGYVFLRLLYYLAIHKEDKENHMEKIFVFQMPCSIAIGYISLLIVLLAKI